MPSQRRMWSSSSGRPGFDRPPNRRQGWQTSHSTRNKTPFWSRASVSTQLTGRRLCPQAPFGRQLFPSPIWCRRTKSFPPRFLREGLPCTYKGITTHRQGQIRLLMRKETAIYIPSSSKRAFSCQQAPLIAGHTTRGTTYLRGMTGPSRICPGPDKMISWGALRPWPL